MNAELKDSAGQPAETQPKYTVTSRTSGWEAMVGLVATLALVVWALTDLPGAEAIRWLALVPGFAGLAGYSLSRHERVQAGTATAMAAELSLVNETLRRQITDLTNLRDMMLAMGATFDRETILDELTHSVTELLMFDRALVLLYDEKESELTFGAYSHAAASADIQFKLEQLRVDVAGAAPESLIGRWMHGESVQITDAATYSAPPLGWLLLALDFRLCYSTPLTVGHRMKGVILVDNSLTRIPISAEQRGLLDALAASIAVNLENARLYHLTDEQLTARVQELDILSRVDRELNDALNIERVLNLTLDWALRFSGAHSAMLALVDQSKTRLRYVSGYGYRADQWEQIKGNEYPLDLGLAGRVAQRGEAEIVPDAKQDASYVEIMPDAASQLSVPVMREGRVIAVITLESHDVNAFTQDNLEFVERLAGRAAVALENARLFDETRRERRKLELILSSTSDAVIVVDEAGSLILINHAALSTFHLPPKEDYAGRALRDVPEMEALIEVYEGAVAQDQRVIAEVCILKTLRTYHVSIVPAPDVGWTIVMHDITPFKETDQLKTELVATASHDLKNPLSVMLGYLDLINMTNDLNVQGKEYMRRAQRSIAHMRDLIDDLLDMARIESGLKLSLGPVNPTQVVHKALDGLVLQAKEKETALVIEVPPDLPAVWADEHRLIQILDNLIGNAIKYTPLEGHVWVRAEQRGGFVQFAVRDDGLGIGPEDQTQVFQRFYRVRTPETDSIEGTGMGLAIVKSLVEIQGGQIGLESRLGEGSTFTFTMPITPPHESSSRRVQVVPNDT